ncbi:MAG: endonuclease/exonuclease/phosphatase [Parcubacteria group bacterium Greene0416_79]|nr:MAG: endonuclease/exonuclease/phosphatase [Parcubacteria group bacterium Greene0416_79]
MGKDTHRIKLVSLNVELDRHLDRVIPFLLKENPDAVCLQEVYEKDMPKFRDALQMAGDFEPASVLDVRIENGALVRDAELAKKGPHGVAFFTRLPVKAGGVEYYFGDPKKVPRHSVCYNRFLLWRRLEKDGTLFTLGTTHFTWTPDGAVSEEQRQDIQALLKILRQFPDIVFCGDFNAPRGGEIWSAIAARYTDNIPAHYATSIDPNLHRKKGLQHMVDGLFSTPHYACRETRLQCGVSDHCAVIGVIERVE